MIGSASCFMVGASCICRFDVDQYVDYEDSQWRVFFLIVFTSYQAFRTLPVSFEKWSCLALEDQQRAMASFKSYCRHQGWAGDGRTGYCRMRPQLKNKMSRGHFVARCFRKFGHARCGCLSLGFSSFARNGDKSIDGSAPGYPTGHIEGIEIFDASFFNIMEQERRFCFLWAWDSKQTQQYFNRFEVVGGDVISLQLKLDRCTLVHRRFLSPAWDASWLSGSERNGSWTADLYGDRWGQQAALPQFPKKHLEQWTFGSSHLEQRLLQRSKAEVTIFHPVILCV